MNTHILQPTKRASTCFHPCVSHSLMVRFDVTEPLVTVSSPDGLSIEASYIHLRTGKIEHTRVLHLEGDVRLYFVASEFPNWYYILKFSSFYQRYGCSCKDGKQGQHCEHVDVVVAA